jgi:hypothetical protein
VSRDSQGRVRVETTETRRGPNGPNGPNGATGTSETPRTHITISDPVSKVIREVDTQNKTVHEMAVHMPPAGATRGPRQQGNRPAPPADPNVKNEDLGSQTINGESAKGTRFTHTVPAGSEGNARQLQTVRETWMSSDLKVPVSVKVVDPRRGTTLTQLSNINRAEPDPTLFQVPAGYTVHSGPGRGGPRNQNQNR